MADLSTKFRLTFRHELRCDSTHSFTNKFLIDKPVREIDSRMQLGSFLHAKLRSKLCTLTIALRFLIENFSHRRTFCVVFVLIPNSLLPRRPRLDDFTGFRYPRKEFYFGVHKFSVFKAACCPATVSGSI